MQLWCRQPTLPRFLKLFFCKFSFRYIDILNYFIFILKSYDIIHKLFNYTSPITPWCTKFVIVMKLKLLFKLCASKWCYQPIKLNRVDYHTALKKCEKNNNFFPICNDPANIFYKLLMKCRPYYVPKVCVDKREALLPPLRTLAAYATRKSSILLDSE